MIGYRAKEPNLRTNENVCDVIEKTVVDDSEKSADRLGAPRSCVPRALSIHLLFLLAYTRQQPRGPPPVFRFPANETSLQVFARFPHRISAARLCFSSSLQLLVVDTSSFYPVSVREIVREGSALQQMKQLPRHFSNM